MAAFNNNQGNNINHGQGGGGGGQSNQGNDNKNNNKQGVGIAAGLMELHGFVDQPKATDAVGTVFDEKAFQLGGFLEANGSISYKDPIVELPKLFPGFSFFCLPHLGV